MDIKEIRQLSGLSQKEFGNKYKIPYRTIQNWEADVNSQNYRKCPEYILSLLERVVREDFGYDK